jgi:formate C-acetyltransferase
MNDPQQHRDLLVRVSGYTAYFKDLNPQMQQEIIERTEYNLSTGHAVAFPAALQPGSAS